jgi:glycosyltransferase involved in cell wall biosynthesis
LKVLFVTNGFPPRGRWGTEFYTWQLVGGLVARGVEVVILHPRRDGSRSRYTLERVRAAVPPVDAEGEGPEVPVYLLHNAGDPAKSFEASYRDREVETIFGEVLDAEAPDLVHFTYLLWGLSVGLPAVAKARGIPSVVTLTDYGLLCHRGQMYDWRLARCEGPHPAEVCARCVREPSKYDDPWSTIQLRRALVRGAALLGGLGRVVVTADLARREAAVRESLEAVDHFIAPTAVFARHFQSWGIPTEKLTELVYSFDHHPYEVARAEPERPDPTSPIRFGFMGQFTPHKGLGTLVEATRIMQARLPESVEPWRVHLYGRPAGGRHRLFAGRILGGELGPRLVVEEPFEPHEAPQILARLNAVVVPSEWDENAPLTILQARAAGVPVIGSDMEGIEEVVDPPHHGLIFRADDAHALADVMREVILGRIGRLPQTHMPMELDAHLDAVLGVYSGVYSGVLPQRSPS